MASFSITLEELNAEECERAHAARRAAARAEEFLLREDEQVEVEDQEVPLAPVAEEPPKAPEPTGDEPAEEVSSCEQQAQNIENDTENSMVRLTQEEVDHIFLKLPEESIEAPASSLPFLGRDSSANPPPASKPSVRELPFPLNLAERKAIKQAEKEEAARAKEIKRQQHDAVARQQELEAIRAVMRAEELTSY